jgi:hypothetical protein
VGQLVIGSADDVVVTHRGSFLSPARHQREPRRVHTHRHLTEMRAKIGRLTDAPGSRRGHDPVMENTIRLDGIDPPIGRVSLAGGVEVVFVGWLGLLRALSELLEAESG